MGLETKGIVCSKRGTTKPSSLVRELRNHLIVFIIAAGIK
jgi:hypothetical protein